MSLNSTKDTGGNCSPSLVFCALLSRDEKIHPLLMSSWVQRAHNGQQMIDRRSDKSPNIFLRGMSHQRIRGNITIHPSSLNYDFSINLDSSLKF